MGTPKRIYTWFRKGYRLPFAGRMRTAADDLAQHECPDFLLSRYAQGSEKQIALDKLVKQLLEKEAIQEVPAGTRVVFNRVFLREKPAKPRQVGKEFRLIIDLTRINQYLKLKKFHMDTPLFIRKHVETGMWATSLDFSDAYHHVPIRKDFHKYLAFQVGNKKYWYTVCPFGLSPIPQVFTEAMSALKWHSRACLQIMTFQYLDDWLLLFKSPSEAANKTLEFARLCVSLGLLVNLDKSELCPTQSITHLGIKWDLRHAWVQPSDKQVQNIQTAANAMLKAGKATVHMLESLLGRLVAAEKQTHLGRINFRMFQRTVTRAVQTAPTSAWIRLPLVSLEDLAWWADSFNLLRGVPCIPPKPHAHITTDASSVGWGAYWGEKVILGKWSEHQLGFHINKKELLVVLYSLVEWGEALENQAVQFWMDNRTAVSYISKQGGTRSISMTLLAREIFQCVNGLNIWISAKYIPGELNVIADMYSRADMVLKTEWMLAPETFQWVRENNLLGEPVVDLFANRFTAQCQRYGSPCPDILAELVDALASDWPPLTLYAFPPVCIMDRVIVKIHQERPRALILIAPKQTTAPWYPFLTKWEKTMIPIPDSKLRLIQPHISRAHPNPYTLCLTMIHITYED